MIFILEKVQYITLKENDARIRSVFGCFPSQQQFSKIINWTGLFAEFEEAFRTRGETSLT